MIITTSKLNSIEQALANPTNTDVFWITGTVSNLSDTTITLSCTYNQLMTAIENHKYPIIKITNSTNISEISCKAYYFVKDAAFNNDENEYRVSTFPQYIHFVDKDISHISASNSTNSLIMYLTGK